MKTFYFYKRYGKRVNKKLHATYTANTEHECWRQLMTDEGIEKIQFTKSKFLACENPRNEESLSETISVNLKAFTEMRLGTYEATKTSYGYSIVLKSGKKMKFDKTGLQMNPNNPKFANRIELAY